MIGIFEEKLRSERASFRYAKGESLERGKEIHTYHEIIYYIDGDAEILTESFKEKLRPGALLLIPRASYHSMRIEDGERYTRLVINFPHSTVAETPYSDIMSAPILISHPRPEVLEVLSRMCRVLRGEKDARAESCLYGALLTLLYELSEYGAEDIRSTVGERRLVIKECISYVDAHIGERLLTRDVAHTLGVSESTLLHVFKREMGISLHKYVAEKRMIYASREIESGRGPTEVYSECGYSDYSSFYKAYVSMFGTSPGGRRA